VSVPKPFLSFERHHRRKAFMMWQFMVFGQQIFPAKLCFDKSQASQNLVVIRAVPDSNCDKKVPFKVVKEVDQNAFVPGRISLAGYQFVVPNACVCYQCLVTIYIKGAASGKGTRSREHSIEEKSADLESTTGLEKLKEVPRVAHPEILHLLPLPPQSRQLAASSPVPPSHDAHDQCGCFLLYKRACPDSSSASRRAASLPAAL
jgi:hypothetical protein